MSDYIEIPGWRPPSDAAWITPGRNQGQMTETQYSTGILAGAPASHDAGPGDLYMRESVRPGVYRYYMLRSRYAGRAGAGWREAQAGHDRHIAPAHAVQLWEQAGRPGGAYPGHPAAVRDDPSAVMRATTWEQVLSLGAGHEAGG